MTVVFDGVLSGSGHLTGLSDVGAVQSYWWHVTNFGNGWPLDDSLISRFLHLGWYSWYYDTVAFPQTDVDAAFYQFGYRFIDFEFSMGIYGQDPFFPSDPDGLTYWLGPGVEAHLTIAV